MKIHGFRIELGEIEAVLAREPSVAQVAVIAWQDRLVAYVVAAGGDVTALHAAAARALPDYMVPAAFVVLDMLPLSVNGKVDRAALPAPTFHTGTASRPPRGGAEQILCELFAEILGVGNVGVDDSFFDLGGDSIMSIQLVSRARRVGIELTPRDVFQNRTVAALSEVARVPADAVPEVSLSGSGALPCTPIMEWLRERGGPVNAFQQSMVLRTPAGMSTAQLETIVQALTDRHDVLRLTMTATADAWEMTIRPPDAVTAADCLERIRLADDPAPAMAEAVEAAVASAQSWLDPSRGRVVRFVWLDGGAAHRGRLAIVAHHLVVDGVSWRILMTDIADAWRHTQAGEPADLLAIGCSFRGWAVYLDRERERRRDQELAMWTSILHRPMMSLSDRALDPVADTIGSARELRTTLTVEQTVPLLTHLPALVHGGVTDVLVTALAAAIGRWNPAEGPLPGGVRIDLEGHGRQEVDGIDLSRTVGWFTTIHPVHVPVHEWNLTELTAGGPAAGRALKYVKESNRVVPDGGIGFGLLRYPAAQAPDALTDPAPSEISFNYLGRFQAATLGDWTPAEQADAIGAGGDDGMPLSHVLDVNAWVEDGDHGPRLSVVWSWPGRFFDVAAIRRLADLWVGSIDGLIAYGRRPDAGGHTPSDFGLALLNQDDIDLLEAEWSA